MKPLPSRLATFLAVALISLPVLRPALAAEPDQPGLLVFAAASLTDVLGELSPAWTKSSGVPVKLSFAASSVLARQIEAGGKADVFISADSEWLNYLDQRSLVDKATRRNLVGNRLVLIAPADSPVAIDIKPGFDLLGVLHGGRLSTGDPDTVPVGRYARSALTTLGVWNDVADRLVRADNVRSAMMFVARGEAPLGIVYTTDALVDPEVRIVATFPDDTHAPIGYPAATLGSRPEARAFLLFLASAKAAPVWKKYGFRELR